MLTSLTSVLVLSLLFGLSHEQYVTLLPKSITTAIGMGVSEELGGIATITVAVIIVTGILGNILAPLVCRVFRIHEPAAVGIALGSSAHAIGTTKAMELGEIQGGYGLVLKQRSEVQGVEGSCTEGSYQKGSLR